MEFKCDTPLPPQFAMKSENDLSYFHLSIPDELPMQIHNLAPLSPSNPLLGGNLNLLEGFISGIQISGTSHDRPVILAVANDTPGARKVLASKIFIPPSESEAELSKMIGSDRRNGSRCKHCAADMDCGDLSDLQNMPHLPTKTKLSMLLKDIHTAISHQHSFHQGSRRKRIRRMPEDDALDSVVDVVEAFEIDIKRVPTMDTAGILSMVEKLFGSDQAVCDAFRKEQIDGSSFVLLSVDSFVRLLKVPVGIAVTLDGIARLSRREHGITSPV
ncbi:uncharacterized protein LOC129602787 [Paramacrobiotus metropolitanus]|uniref:uncharacterized protein LOC129602787 n=1 Tax=Paramacrobiotus metropolitanus TaxID=2943436 RepID=UPI002445EBDA|nr:uncharacterized protein LOC129602787 [Paramacrobiotus metropolitanus]